MQVSKKDFNRSKHIVLKALTVKNPFAYYIAQGIKKIEIRSQYTKYRGDLHITSSASPKIEDMTAGALSCKVILYDCKKVSELTKYQWFDTCLPESMKEELKDYYAWFLKDVVQLVEIPVKGNLGIWNLYIGKQDVTEYPKEYIEVLSKQLEKASEAEKKTILNKIQKTVKDFFPIASFYSFMSCLIFIFPLS